jgi:two-component system sensor histidine kinase TctE
MAGARSAASLRRRLLSWILLPLTGLIGVNAWIGYGNAVQVTNEAYDRALYLAARTLAEELEWRDGQLQLDVRRAAGYLFEHHTGSRLFYRVQTPEGRLLAGDGRLPSLPGGGPPSVHYFALVRFDDSRFQGQPVRLAQLVHVLEDSKAPNQVLQITVVETLEARQQLIQQILRNTLTSQGLLLLAAALLVVWGVQRGILPLEAWRQRLAAKDDTDFSPIELPDVPRELRPLVATLNSYLERLGRLIEIRKRFLDNAAHQLRTPLTVLKTTLTLAERSGSPEQNREAILAARKTTDEAVHLTEQLLAMTRAEHGRDMHSPNPIDLVVLARQVTDEHLLRAHDRGDDLGFETEVQACMVAGIDTLLHEAMANLLDNALHHAGPGAHITARVGQGWMEVEDDGPGIAPEHQPHVFERFYRAAPAARSGSGLGLAIVREIALQHGAAVSLRSPVREGRGTVIRIHWRLP